MAAREAGLDVLAITDHDAIENSLAAVELAADYGLTAIPGIEISSADGHVLGLGTDEVVPAGHSFERTVEWIHDQGGVAIVPHPYQKLRKGVLTNVEEADLTRADAIEVCNSRFLTGRTNRKARQLAAELSMPVTAGSDAHVPSMVGKAATVIDADPNRSSVLEAIRTGRTTIDGGRTPLQITLRQAAGTARRRITTIFGGWR